MKLRHNLPSLRLKRKSHKGRVGPKIIAAIVTAATFQILLFDAPPGIGWAIAALVIAVAVIATSGGSNGFALALAAASTAPLAYDATSLSSIIALVLLAWLALSAASRDDFSLAKAPLNLLTFALTAPIRLPLDANRIARVPNTSAAPTWRAVLGWAAPLAIGASILVLFAIANPLIERGLSSLRPGFPERTEATWRVLAFILSLSGIWPFLRPSRLNRLDAKFSAPRITAALSLRTLLVCNVVFAAQISADSAILIWGAALPEGVTYAEYAHRGAYPLIVATMLAGGFILIAANARADEEQTRRIRRLIYLWLAQTGLLLGSSALRLAAYVEAYGLTHLRLAAFIWMVVVASGLMLIVIRIAVKRDARWLLAANVVTTGAILYVCCFLNFAATIADHNADAQINGTAKAEIDLEHFMALGPHAIPAADRLNETGAITPLQTSTLAAWRKAHAAELQTRHSDWRAFSLKDWRLARYLAG